MNQGRRESGDRWGEGTSPPTISGAKKFFSLVKSENIKFLHVNNM